MCGFGESGDGVCMGLLEGLELGGELGLLVVVESLEGVVLGLERVVLGLKGGEFILVGLLDSVALGLVVVFDVLDVVLLGLELGGLEGLEGGLVVGGGGLELEF
jgi:hypothetical protein